MTRAQLLDALLREQRGNLAAVEAEATDGPACVANRRRILNDALAPAQPYRGRRLRRRPVIGRMFHLPRPASFVPWDGPDSSLRPWESRDGYAAEMFDGWAE